MGDVIIDGLTGANRLVILDANGKIPALDGSAVTAIAGANFSTGTIPVARLDTGTTAGKIVKLDGNAKLPAVSGAALTGIVGATKNASDPTISTNPSGGVGTEWHNTTSGEVYVCTDATAGENVWTNVGGHSGDIIPWYFGGDAYGYHLGAGPPALNTRGKYSFTSDGNGVDAGDLSLARFSVAGAQSATHGYAAGGSNGNGVGNTIDKFVFSVEATSTDVGDLTTTGSDGPAGQSSETYGYAHGGHPPALTRGIDKYAFATDGNATDIGDCVVNNLGWRAGCSSTTYGYAAAGHGPPQNDTIEKHSFASDGNASDIGNLVVDVYSSAGAQY